MMYAIFLIIIFLPVIFLMLADYFVFCNLFLLSLAGETRDIDNYHMVCNRIKDVSFTNKTRYTITEFTQNKDDYYIVDNEVGSANKRVKHSLRRI